MVTFQRAPLTSQLEYRRLNVVFEGFFKFINTFFVTGAEPVFRYVGGACFSLRGRGLFLSLGRSLFLVTWEEPVFCDLFLKKLNFYIFEWFKLEMHRSGF